MKASFMPCPDDVKVTATSERPEKNQKNPLNRFNLSSCTGIKIPFLQCYKGLLGILKKTNNKN